MMTGEVLVTHRGEYVGADWLPVTRGVRRRGGAADPWRADLAAWAEVLPEGARFTHLTAARLRGWWLPPLPDELPVFVALPPGSHRIRRPGLVAIRRSQETFVDVLSGLPVDPVEKLLAACARDLGVLDLTCLVDAALACGDTSADRLITEVRLGGRGVGHLRRSCALADARSESIYEVLLRVMHLVCGIDVEPQHVAHDEAGLFLARGDLWLQNTRVLHEYDGGDHLARRQQRKDRERDRRLGHADWIRRGYTREDLLHQAVAILRDADVTIGREHDPARIRPWHELLRGSTFTASGMFALRSRLGLGMSLGLGLGLSGHVEMF